MVAATDIPAPRGRGEVARIVLSTIEEVAAEQHQAVPSLDPATRLIESGLDSLCLAVIVARLEDRLGVDPLSQNEETALPTTIGAFVSLYESALR